MANEALFHVRVHHDVRADLEALPVNVRKRIIDAIADRLGKAPAEYGQRLRQSLRGYWKLRVGDYRVVYEIAGKDIRIYGVMHRREVYARIEKRPWRWDDAQVVVRSLPRGEQKVLIDGGADARYVPTGHLVYAHMGTLRAVPFDRARLETTGSASALVGNVMQSVNNGNSLFDTGAAQFGVSDTGTLVYVPGGIAPDPKNMLVWVDRRGVVEPLLPETGAYMAPRLSPDGRRVAFSTYGMSQHVWIYDLLRGGAPTRLTGEGQNVWSIWTPDSARVTFATDLGLGSKEIRWRLADGSQPAESLTSGARDTPGSWSPDKTLAFVRGSDIWLLSFEGASPKSRPWFRTPASEDHPDFSPDGRWLAYESDESGRSEVYVRPYPGPGGREQVSTAGGTSPAWSRNGRELFYAMRADPRDSHGPKTMMAVHVSTDPTFIAGKPRSLFTGQYGLGGPARGYDITPDGRRFLMVDVSGDPPPPRATQMVVVLNWMEELKRRVPAR